MKTKREQLVKKKKIGGGGWGRGLSKLRSVRQVLGGTNLDSEVMPDR